MVLDVYNILQRDNWNLGYDSTFNLTMLIVIEIGHGVRGNLVLRIYIWIQYYDHVKNYHIQFYQGDHFLYGNS